LLECATCNSTYPIIKNIPRFVPLDNYCDSFGYEWLTHPKTQYDDDTGVNISETRFFNETEWPKDLKDQVILEAGSGSGRFTRHAASTGAMIVSFDYSQAVEANFAANGIRENVLIVQADMYLMPFPKAFFDKVFCLGVLQHTPDPEAAFHCLTHQVKPGGSLVIDNYRKFWFLKQLCNTRYWVRPFTRQMNPEKLYNWCERYVNIMWPLASFLSRNLGRYGRTLNWMLLIADYRGILDLSEEQLKEWATLDTFDVLSPMYDYPQTRTTIKKWFEDAGLMNIEVDYGFNGVYGRANRPLN
jgi:SAM-dependent methyltransferase